jgi:signal transduction histidine kinase
METLAAVGELSAGVAHEIRNCLNPITGCIEMLRSDDAVTGESRRLMDLITLEGERLNQFIGELLEFARMDELHSCTTDVAGLLEEVAMLLRCHTRRKEGQTVEANLDGPQVTCVDPEQLKRVFVNLGLNALEAMEEGGCLRLSLEQVGEGPAAELAAVFEDDGPGIRPEHLREVFEPFFTTKREGTGLGLSLARQVVERHGGRIKAENRNGGGARFVVSLPREAMELPLKSAA